MSFTELIQELHKLSPEELETVRRELDGMQEKSFEVTPEMQAAIEEGIWSAENEPLISIEELRKEMLTWSTDSK